MTQKVGISLKALLKMGRGHLVNKEPEGGSVYPGRGVIW